MRFRSILAVVTTASVTLSVAATIGVSAPASAAPCGNRGIFGSSLAFGSSLGGLLGRRSDQKPLPRVPTGNTRTVGWVTGALSQNHTDTRFGISGTDLGISWDNGSGQTLMAFGDTYGDCNAPGQQWRHNTILRTSDTTPGDGVGIPSGVPGNVRSGASVSSSTPRRASESVPSPGIPGVAITTIPTAGIAINGIQFMNYMSVRSWGDAGRWVTNYSAVAVSRDNGQTWTTAQSTVRPNLISPSAGAKVVDDSNGKFQQSAYLTGRDGFIYQYGTPNGRFGAAFVTRFRPADILDLKKYEYFTGDKARPWSPDQTRSKAIVREPVGEMSVAWNAYLGRYLMLAGNNGNGSLALRTATAPEGPWSAPTTLLNSRQLSGVYAPYIYAGSPKGGQYLYFTASRWQDYNVMMLRTDLTRIPVR
ncbi:DUF4185 domain-containing protein [Williamsia maris]|uniref:DUF4185 domain-containing protein n=1 Tax=Williamsia maris TaxID=72806 RepID=A0ABT1HGJ0_9NOCA|nr:DUF4185 domain-containing protein [Williamsia maris]MCP2177304.1 protein of unknown function (DUF4185) [Williamsia maris]